MGVEIILISKKAHYLVNIIMSKKKNNVLECKMLNAYLYSNLVCTSQARGGQDLEGIFFIYSQTSLYHDYFLQIP